MSSCWVLTMLIVISETHSAHSPLDSSTSAVTLIVKGNSLGMTDLKAFSARAPAIQTHRHQQQKPHNLCPFWMDGHLDFVHTMTELSPVESCNFSRFICCIWWELKIKKMHVLNVCGKKDGKKNHMLYDIEGGFLLLHNEAWSFCLWCHCGEEINEAKCCFESWI